MIRLVIWWVLFTVFAPSWTQAQVSFRATAYPNRTSVDAPVRIIYTLTQTSQGSKFQPPDLSAFIVIGGPSEESSIQTINGKVDRSLSISYDLLPRKAGNFLLQPAKIYSGGQLYTSNTVAIAVDPSSSNAKEEIASDWKDYVLRKGEQPEAKLAGNILVVADVQPRDVFPGQPITLTYKLYTRLKSESHLQRYPPLPGFSVFEHTPMDSEYPSTETRNGKNYQVYTLREVQLYASLPGVQVLPPLEVDNDVYFLEEELLQQQGPYVDMLLERFIQGDPSIQGFRKVSLPLRSDSVRVNIRSFPPPPDSMVPFYGAVGKFQLRSWVETRADQRGQWVVVELSGQGNLPLINVPEPSWPVGVEVFDAEALDTLDKNRIPITGSRKLRFPITVKQAGTCIIPSIAFRYFDPATNRYETTRTDSLRFSVTAEQLAQQTAGIDLPKSSRSWADYLFTHRWLIVLPLLLAVLSFLGWHLWKQRRSRSNISSEPAAPEPAGAVLLKRDPFAQSRAMFQIETDPRLSWRTLDQELRWHIGERLNLTQLPASRQAIEQAVKKHVLPITVWQPIWEALQTIEHMRFLPGNTTPVEETWMLQLIESVEAFDQALSQQS
jgi:hypothetical protein